MFFVDAEGPDRDLVEIFRDKTVYPHLVDLDEPPDGWCSCRDFQKNCVDTGRTKCIHIIHAIRYRNLMIKPKNIPANLFVNDD